ncbi:EcoKI restriction-modification system protein HsdS [Anaerobiospirillum thomasii]|uniref:EcoKI restriction-modification system protein HsdS n=2 Tax=Anaerobiospirillum thomasii TaxID=179995 RepID=A0A2X0WSV5_9GAMM|nr:EcoKI restriction-modification system protein HsdS [Anaerobiospirillum thomasii]
MSKVGYVNTQPDNKYKLRNGDILYSNINSLKHIGKVAFYCQDLDLYHGTNLLRISPDSNNFPYFIFENLSKDSSKAWAYKHASIAVNQASINIKTLSSQEIFICSYDEQKKIGRCFHQLNTLITLHQRM